MLSVSEEWARFLFLLFVRLLVLYVCFAPSCFAPPGVSCVLFSALACVRVRVLVLMWFSCFRVSSILITFETYPVGVRQTFRAVLYDEPVEASAKNKGWSAGRVIDRRPGD